MSRCSLKPCLPPLTDLAGQTSGIFIWTPTAKERHTPVNSVELEPFSSALVMIMGRLVLRNWRRLCLAAPWSGGLAMMVSGSLV